jgi:hypothetical protein
MRQLKRLLLLQLSAIAWTASAAAASPLPSSSPDRHLGVGSCASSVCHGAVQPLSRPGALMNEFVTWSHDDAHAKAYQALTGVRGHAIGAKLGIASPESAKLCLDCHADNVAANQRGKKFSLSDGVGCEACHGGAERWIASHSAKSSYGADLKNGMYPTAELAERATLCLSCHVGTADKFATHRIMCAGHPRLRCELDTFLALEPVHYRIDDHYRERKPAYSKTQSWARGQLLAAEAQLRNLQGALAHSTRTFPELALFNCTSCHDSSMQRLDWRSRQLTQGIDTGTVLLNDANLRMCWVIARSLGAREGDEIKEQVLALQKDAVADWPHIGASSARLHASLAEILSRVESQRTSLGARVLLDGVLQAGIEGEYRDYLGAEQAVMAIDLLLMDANLAAKYQAQRDELYRLLRSDDTYRSNALVTSLRALRDALQ